MRLLSESDVASLLDPELALASAEEAYRRHAGAGAQAPGRIDLRPPGGGLGMLMLAALGPDGLACVKTNLHRQPSGCARRHASLLTLWNTEACRPTALISGLAFNRARTAAGFAAACRLLAPPKASRLALFGAGAMAPETARLICAVRPIREIRIVGRSPERASALARSLAAAPDFAGVRVAAETDPRAAAGAADVVVAVTSADAPVFPGDAVRDGALVVLGGANRPAAREADDLLIGRARIFVDHLEGCLARAGDLVIPLASGALRHEAIHGEIGAAFDAPPPSFEGVTVFKSIGIAMQDLTLASMLLARAETLAVGVAYDTQDGLAPMSESAA